MPQKEYHFKMSFSLDPTRPTFILKAIMPEDMLSAKEEAKAAVAEKVKTGRKKLLHDSILRLQGRQRVLNGANRYFELNGENKRATGELVTQIYNDLYEIIGADAAAFFTASKTTQKRLDRFGAVSEHDLDWTRHLDYIDAHIESLKSLIEKQL